MRGCIETLTDDLLTQVSKYGSFVYWLGQRVLSSQKVGSEPPRVTIAHAAQLDLVNR